MLERDTQPSIKVDIMSEPTSEGLACKGSETLVMYTSCSSK